MTNKFEIGSRGGVTRRTFLRTSTGVVLTSILRPQALAAEGVSAQAENSLSQVPGVATQRIDGYAKVTGQKVYARDFNARDMGPDWPEHQCHAMFLRALTTKQKFLGIDTDALPAAAKRARLVLGNELSEAQRSPRLSASRDPSVDQKILARYAIKPDQEGFDRPSAVLFDLIVQPGNRPDFLGQAVALLIFDDSAGLRDAQNAMQFQDRLFQVYDEAVDPAPSEDRIFYPETTYVKYAVDNEVFDYATANPKAYSGQVDAYRSKIKERLSAIDGLVRHDFKSDMCAMDPMFMEPEAGLAWHDADRKTLHLVLGTQSPDGDVSEVLSMYREDDAPFQIDRVELTSCFPGGGFGGRDKSPFSLMLGLAAAFTKGRPVKLAYDRFEQFRVGLKRHAATLEGQIAVAPDMRLQNIEMQLQFDGGGRKNLSPYVASLAALCAGGAYATPMANIYANAFHSENVSGGSQRGFGGPQAFFAIETALDDVAHEKGWDPVELRRANLIAKGDTTVVGGPVKQSLRLDEVLDAAEAHPLWSERTTLQAEYAERGLHYGTGFALSLQAYGTSGDGMVAAVLLNDDGSFTVQSDAVDMGNGSATTLGVVIGDILGANATRVDMGCYTLFGQTGLTTRDDTGHRWANPNWTAKSVGSSSACLTALHQVHVVQQAAQGLFLATILPAARAFWTMPDLTRDDIEWIAGALHMKLGDAPPLPLGRIASLARELNLPRGTLGHAYFQDSWAEADFHIGGNLEHLILDGLALYHSDSETAQPVQRQNAFGPNAQTRRYSRYVWAPCANVVGLTVDRATGRVQIENIVSVLNAGRVHVPELVSGQSQGGVAMAISYTLHEDMPPGMSGPANGTWNLNRYHVARAKDVPLNPRYSVGKRAQELIILPESQSDQRQGRGIAEAVMCSIPPAISNALKDAVGVRYTSLPITQDKVLEGLQK